MLRYFTVDHTGCDGTTLALTATPSIAFGGCHNLGERSSLSQTNETPGPDA